MEIIELVFNVCIAYCDRPTERSSFPSKSVRYEFQVQQSVMPSSHSHTGSGGSLRHQPTYPPPVSSHSSYRLQDAALFSSTPNLYTYPASAALASVSQAVDQMQGGRPSGAYSSLALLQKNVGLALSGSAAGQYSNPQPQPFHRSSAAYQRKLNQFPPYL